MSLSVTQTRAISALLVSKTDKAAARLAGVSPGSIQKWRQMPEFAEALASEQDAILKSVAGNVTLAAENLAKRVLDLSDNPNVEISDLIKLVQFAIPFAVQVNERSKQKKTEEDQELIPDWTKPDA